MDATEFSDGEGDAPRTLLRLVLGDGPQPLFAHDSTGATLAVVKVTRCDVM